MTENDEERKISRRKTDEKTESADSTKLGQKEGKPIIDQVRPKPKVSPQSHVVSVNKMEKRRTEQLSYK